MFFLPDAVKDLIASLSKLPGVGPRSAERIALHLIQSDLATVQRLASSITHAREIIRCCTTCGALTEQDPCVICSDSRRDSSLLCLVEKPVDILVLEKSGSFKGKYHVLGGKISPLNGVGPEDLRISELEERIPREQIREIIVALPSDVEGDATTYYLSKRLTPQNVQITRLAQGLPAGSALDFADDVTILRALEGRRPLE